MTACLFSLLDFVNASTVNYERKDQEINIKPSVNQRET